MPKVMLKRKDVDEYKLPPMEQRRYQCVECRREFQSPKALHGHMRVHSAKGYRGVKKPPAKKPRINVEIAEPDQELDFDKFLAAEILMILRRNAEEATLALAASTRGPVEVAPPAKPTYSCSTCNKSFDTHQALGGHVASHNKHRRVGAGEAGTERARDRDAAKPPTVHRCDECGEVFASKHFHERHNAAAVAAAAALRAFVLDLNVAPANEDEGAN